MGKINLKKSDHHSPSVYINIGIVNHKPLEDTKFISEEEREHEFSKYLFAGISNYISEHYNTNSNDGNYAYNQGEQISNNRTVWKLNVRDNLEVHILEYESNITQEDLSTQSALPEGYVPKTTSHKIFSIYFYHANGKLSDESRDERNSFYNSNVDGVSLERKLRSAVNDLENGF